MIPSASKTINKDLHFDQVALEYDFMADLFHNPSFFLDNVPQRRHIALDLGCGSGLMVQELSTLFDTVIGIDRSFSLLSIAKLKRNACNISYIQADIEDLSLNNQVDYIISKNVFHHLTDVETIINKLKSLLKPQGRLVLTDVVSRTETPARYIYHIGALQEYLPNIKAYGFTTANRIFRFRISKHWLSHLSSDRYLSPEGFESVYSALLPNAIFPRAGHLIWEKN